MAPGGLEVYLEGNVESAAYTAFKTTDMAYIKTYKDNLALLLMITCLLTFIGSLVEFGWPGLISIPILFLVFYVLITWLSTGKLPKRDTGFYIRTAIVKTDGTMQRVNLVLEEDCIVCKHIRIPFECITRLLFEDKTTSEWGMAGFGIDYMDGGGSASLYFFNNGFRAVSRARKSVQAILEAHRSYYKGCRIEPLEVVNASKVSSSWVHREPFRPN